MGNRAFKYIIYLSICHFLFSCSFYSDKNLGSNYYFWEDGNQSQIVYGENGPQGGFTIVDANVYQYAFDDRYIIAKSNWLVKNGNETYWIIDKRIKINKDTTKKGEKFENEMRKGLIGPLSEDIFKSALQKYNIALELKDALK